MDIVRNSDHSKQTAKHRGMKRGVFVAGIFVLILACGTGLTFRSQAEVSHSDTLTQVHSGAFMFTYYQRIKNHVQVELDAAHTAEAAGHFGLAFSHLERAHILGQCSTRLHVLTHWRMMWWGVRQRQGSEVIGQLWRIFGAALSTSLGLVPIGNTGGANVSGFKAMAVPADLQAIIDGSNTEA